jgi:hypothetical protein
VLHFPVNALALSLEDFLTQVRLSPGQAMKMPIQLKWGGGLGGAVQSIQILATWARLEGSGRTLRVPSAFASQENTRERFASTLPGMAALYFADQIDCDGEPFSRYDALKVVAPRITAMQSGTFRDTLRGQGAALCCFIGAKNEFLSALYSRALPGEVREVTDFQILLHRILKDLSVRDDALNEGQLDYLSGLIYQLFLNSDEHGSFDDSGARFANGMRGIAVRVTAISDMKSLIHYAGDDTALKSYLLKLALLDKTKSRSFENEDKLPSGSMQLLELSVFDTGPGMGLRWLSEREGRHSYAEISHEEELAAVHTCFEKHATTKASQFKGQGLHQALMALRRLEAFMTLRTGRLSLYQDFSRSDTTAFEPKNRFSKLKRPPEIVGTSYSICFRLK